MAKGHFVLNGKGYIAKRHPRTNKLISRRSTDPFPETQRPEGQQRRTQVKTRSSILFQDFFEGFTHRRSTAEGLTAVHGFFDSLCDTRWGDVYPSILAQDSTETGLEQIRASAVFKGELWAIWQDADSQDLLSRNFTGSTATWENGGTIESNAANVELVGLDLIAHKDRLVVLYAEARRYTAEHSTDGVTWTIAVSGLGPSGQLLSDDITDDEDIDGGLLAEIENELIAVLWDEVNSSITFFSDFSSGVSWDDEAVDIYSANGPQGVAVRRGEDGELKLIVATHEGLWEVDVAPATWTLRKIWDMPGHNDNGRRMAIGPDGAVWFAQGVTDDEAAPIFRLFVEDAEWKVEPVPGSLHLNDTVPSDMLGSIKWWKRSQDFMYASLGGGTVGGSSSLKARIICHAGGGFHHMYQAGTADQPIQWMDVASEDDGTQRLHFAIRTAAGTSDTQFLARPNSSPVNDSNRIYIDNAHLDLPDVNGGMPTTSATWIKVGVDATDLDTLEFIDVTHGLNGAVRTTTDLGNITASISSLKYPPGANAGAGEAGVSDALRLALQRDTGDTTEFAVVRSVEMFYKKKVEKGEEWNVIVDIDATALAFGIGTEEVVTNIETARDLAPLPAFEYGNIGTKFVDVFPLWDEDVQDKQGGLPMAAPDTTVVRSGEVTLVIVEVK